MIGILTKSYQDQVAFVKSHFEPESDLVNLIKGATGEQKKKVKKVMDEWKSGKLKSGSGGKIVDQKQAIAVALSEAGLHKGGYGEKLQKMYKRKGLCEHGEYPADCDKCNPVNIEKDEAGAGGEEDIEESVEKAIHNLFGDELDEITDPIDKAFVDILEKSEGSKGGYVIGHTKSGKPIYEKKRASKYKNFDNQDHKDASKIHGQAALRAHPGMKPHHNGLSKEHYEQSGKINKSHNNDLEKGGAGSNKAGRIIGSTRSGKPIHSLKGAHEYKDFEAVDHEEAYKHHMNHAQKVQGVAAVNSRIRAHDHADQAQIKAAKQEQEEVAAKTAKGSKEIQAKEKAKQMKAGGGAAKKPAAKKKTIKKGEEEDNLLEKAEGSRGGKIIGHTKSGKPIYQKEAYAHASHYKNFTQQDHLDAVSKLEDLNMNDEAESHHEAAKNKVSEKVAKKHNLKKSNEDDELEKGEIFSTFTSTYGDKEPLRFSKSGKEMIKKLKILDNRLFGVISDLQAHMAAEVEMIGDEPDTESNSYSIKGLKTMRYSYDYCYSSSQSSPVVETAVAIPTQKDRVDTKTKDVQQACQKYNDYSSQLLSAMEDVEAIRLIKDNIDLNKKYNLSVTQLASLGF